MKERKKQEKLNQNQEGQEFFEFNVADESHSKINNLLVNNNTVDLLSELAESDEY